MTSKPVECPTNGFVVAIGTSGFGPEAGPPCLVAVPDARDLGIDAVRLAGDLGRALELVGIEIAAQEFQAVEKPRDESPDARCQLKRLAEVL